VAALASDYDPEGRQLPLGGGETDGMLGRGRILVFTGDGKGKTSAAFGSALRASGHGLKVAIIQFIKGPWNYGEVKALTACSGVELHRIGSGYTWLAVDPNVPRRLAQEAWRRAEELVMSDRYDLVVLDELNCAVAEGYVPVKELLDLLARRPGRLSMIITGRAAAPELIETADTVTEMLCVKHAFAQGVPARKGIEY
jgi:cob(I)alamin adenosyltransferase